MTNINFTNPFSLISGDFKETNISSLSYMFMNEDNLLAKLLFAFVSFQMPDTEQTIYNVCKLNNSVSRAVESDDYELLEELFLTNDFLFMSELYSEFAYLDYDRKTELITKVSDRLNQLGYIHEGDEYFGI
jgi:hypothetical protein